MNILEATQGSPAWHAHRAHHFNASEAPAMMGASKYQTRTELLRQKAAGIAADVDDSKQRLFDRGHAAEAAARPIVEAIIGDGLFPVTGTLEVDGLPLLASFDGLTMMEDMAWETKLWNAALADAVRAGQLDPHYYWQLEQQLLVSGAGKVYFTATDGTPENTVGMWYESQPARRAALIAGWKQFAEDLANYRHEEVIAAPVAATIEALPALFVQVEGKVLATNLDAFKQAAQTFIDGIKTELVNDQDFADADKMVKFLKDGEERLALAKQQALAQTASIDELFRTVDAISEQMRGKRLALDRLVKAEKENRRAEIIRGAQDAYMAHVDGLNKRIGDFMPRIVPAFAEAIKGLKSLDSMRDKVATALANAKIAANEIADTIQANRSAVPDELIGVLMPDFAAVCTKDRLDFANLLAARVAAHKEAEEKRLEAEREKIRQEEAEKLEKQNAPQGSVAAAQNVAVAPEAPALSQQPTGEASMPGGSVATSMKGIVPTDLTAQPVSPITDESIIDDYLRLLAISPAAKKELRETLVKFENYRAARLAQLEEAA